MMSRKIDALVAIHIFNNPWEWDEDLNTATSATDSGATMYPPYSTDIAAAWEVVEKLRDSREDITIYTSGRSWWINVGDIFNNVRDMGDFEVVEESAPMAICLAALKAKGVEV